MALRNRLFIGGFVGLIGVAGGYNFVHPNSKDRYHLNRVPLIAHADNGEELKKSSLRAYIDEQTATLKKKLVNKQLPEHVQYVLIGGGTAAYYAALTIRAYDPDSKVLMISAENEAPYNRPPLSKELWLHGTTNVDKTLEYIGVTGKKRDIRYESDGFYLPPATLNQFEHGGVSLLRNTRVTHIDPVNKKVTLDFGVKVKYGKLLIATGGMPKIPYPFYSPHLRSKVMTFHTASDFKKLYRIASESSAIMIYGNSAAASELAFSVQSKFGKDKLKIIYVFPEQYPMQETLPPNVGEFVRNAISNKGVIIESRTQPTFVNKLPNGQVEVTLDKDGEKHQVVVDHIIVAAGNEASTKLAEEAGIRVDSTLGAIIADSKLQTSHSDVFAAGDVVAYDAPGIGQIHSKHWENAQITGRLAGQNMTGNTKDFHHHPSYSSLFGHSLHLFGVGQTDSSLKTVSVFAPPDKEDSELVRGVVFYLKNNKVVGILFCNIFGVAVEIGRKIISDAQEINDFVELAKLFDIYLPKSEELGEEDGDEDETTPKDVVEQESTPIPSPS
uniref:Apoptosis-inducing factor 1, mitochondrial n=1 Tax=Panagrolaimus sp. ES5 TaxID=591445 RepID=A0AC34GU30_9BILA